MCSNPGQRKNGLLLARGVPTLPSCEDIEFLKATLAIRDQFGTAYTLPLKLRLYRHVGPRAASTALNRTGLFEREKKVEPQPTTANPSPRRWHKSPDWVPYH